MPYTEPDDHIIETVAYFQTHFKKACKAGFLRKVLNEKSRIYCVKTRLGLNIPCSI